jgi:hypothetical protein
MLTGSPLRLQQVRFYNLEAEPPTSLGRRTCPKAVLPSLAYNSLQPPNSREFI